MSPCSCFEHWEMRIIEFNMDCDSPESKNSSIFIALSGRVCQTLSTDRPSIDSFTTKKRERTIRRKKNWNRKYFIWSPCAFTRFHKHSKIWFIFCSLLNRIPLALSHLKCNAEHFVFDHKFDFVHLLSIELTVELLWSSAHCYEISVSTIA